MGLRYPSDEGRRFLYVAHLSPYLILPGHLFHGGSSVQHVASYWLSVLGVRRHAEPALLPRPAALDLHRALHAPPVQLPPLGVISACTREPPSVRRLLWCTAPISTVIRLLESSLSLGARWGRV